MSYSFQVRAASKAEAKAKFMEAFDQMVEMQSTHKADRDAQIAHAHNMIDLIREPHDGNEIVVDAHGSVGWNGKFDDVPLDVTSAQGSAFAYQAPVKAA